MKEWHRTIFLLVIIALAIGLMIWLQHNATNSLTSGLSR
jgi:hypothetical protein